QTVMLAQTAVLLVLALLTWFLSRGAGERGSGGEGARGRLWLAGGTALFVTLPFWAWGALGSLLDIFLALALGLLFGWLAGWVYGRFWLRSLVEDSRGLNWDIAAGGFVAGTAVLIMASALSFNGVQLLLMIVLPALGWAAAALSPSPHPSSPHPSSPHPSSPHSLTLLLGLTAAFILMLTDSDGLYLGAFDGILRWAFQAAGVSLPLAWGMGVLLAALRGKLAEGYGRITPALTVITILTAVGVYFTAGQPGLHGDRIFVILKDQADVSSAAQIEDYDQRRQFVYDTLTNHADTTQADLRQSLDRLGIDYTPYYLVNGLEVRGGLPLKWWLSLRPEVARVIPSPVLRPVPENLPLPSQPASAPAEPDWNLTNIGAERVWQEFGVRGQGIVIGQSDSGVQWDHPELLDGYRGREGNHDGNWLDPWNGSPAPADAGGHGTHTLGSVLGNNVGVAPDAEWFACANLYRNLGNPALYLDCMQFMLAPYPQAGNAFMDGDPTRSAHILNNSWGCPEGYEGCDAGSLQTAVSALRAAGIFVVASAGNDGPDCGTITDPIAIYDESFTVGAVDRNDNLAVFSSAGPVMVDGSGRIKPDIVAPGVDVLSAVPGGGYARNSGTSMAGPHVAGVVALIWSANPDLIGDIEGTEAILIESAAPFRPNPEAAGLPEELADAPDFLAEMAAQTADPVSGTCLAETDTAVIPNNVAGYGIVNAYEAVKLALER
ncbi:MAG TPA: peptidase S8, partial [Anaerolineae bacterium]|nr:peptidase S8 [Anaerolineae bacterium]